MQNVKPSQLKLGPNVRQRYNPESIAEMANSIKAVGILQNLLVRPAKRGSPSPTRSLLPSNIKGSSSKTCLVKVEPTTPIRNKPESFKSKR
jgi:hypothetical protein